MRQKRLFEILSVDAMAVVRDGDLFFAAFFDFDTDHTCASVDAVFDELFDY